MDLVARYNRAGDTGRSEDFKELFTSSGVFEMNGGRTAQGGQAIETLMEDVKRQFATAPAIFFPARHHVSGLTIDFADSDHATERSYFLLVGGWDPTTGASTETPTSVKVLRGALHAVRRGWKVHSPSLRWRSFSMKRRRLSDLSREIGLVGTTTSWSIESSMDSVCSNSNDVD